MVALAVNEGWLAFMVAVLLLLALNVPIVMVLERRGWLNTVGATVAGFLIPIIAALLYWAIAVLPYSWPSTPSKLIGFSSFLGMLGSLGAAGGLTAWLIWKASERAPWLWGATAAATLVALFYASGASQDRTCHNPLPLGEWRTETVMWAEVPIGRGEWPDFRDIASDFAVTEGWDFRDYGDPPVNRAPDLSICNADGTRIWLRPGGIVFVQQPQGGESWQEPAARLLEALDRRWPGRLSFKAGGGRETAAPEFWPRRTGADANASLPPVAPAP